MIEARRAGATIVTVDPYRSPTALRSDAAARYHRDGHWGSVSVGEQFAATCARQGYGGALADGNRWLSFAEWERLTQRAALGLLALGVAPGDVVAYQLPNWWEAVVLSWAAWRWCTLPS